MHINGWILISLSWGAIVTLVVFCFTTMFKTGKR